MDYIKTTCGKCGKEIPLGVECINPATGECEIEIILLEWEASYYKDLYLLSVSKKEAAFNKTI